MNQRNIWKLSRKISSAVLVFFVVFGAVIQGAVIDITTTRDNVPGSLRAAIVTANSNGEDDVIYLPAGTYVLSGEAEEDANAGGDLDINTTHKITIIGEGTETTIIDGSQVDRVLHILSGIVSISDVTIQNGKTSDGDEDSEKGADGGGIYNNGTLSLTRCSIINNRCGKGNWGNFTPWAIVCPGSGGYGGGIYNSDSLTLTGCTIANNSAGECGGAIEFCYVPSGGHGGGIYNSSTGSQLLNNCTISNNNSGNGFERGYDHDTCNNGGDGGGICNYGSQELINCTITFNRTGNGGTCCFWDGERGGCGHGAGIYNSGVSTIEKCIINNNTNSISNTEISIDFNGNGAGIYNSGELTLTDSTISNNNNSQGGSGGGIFNHQGTLILTRCLITGNNTGDGVRYYLNPDGGSGGGIYNRDILYLTNCTVSSNNTGNGCSERYHNGGNGGDGGGICNHGTVYLKNSTIVNNTTGSGGNGGNEPGNLDGRAGFGGGIYNSSPAGTVNIKNTIAANNRVKTGGEGADAWGTLNSRGYNLIENPNHCFITGVLSGNITGVDPMLGPLADNGGPTKTHALLPGSPGIDAGNSSGITKDQRGVTRPIDIPGIANVSDGSDIGAFEFNLETSPAISGTIIYSGTGLADVILTFSNNGGTTGTDDRGKYSHPVMYGWSGKVSPSKPGYIFTPLSRSYSHVKTTQTNQDYTAIPALPSRISLNRTYLNFGADSAGHQTGSQHFLITNSGGGILNWSISDDAQWLYCSPTTGTGPAVVTVSISLSGLAPGSYTGTITVEDTDAINSPQFINVTLTVYTHDSTQLPFGCFDTPGDGSIVISSIPVTGWVLDDIGIEYVKIHRKAEAGEGNGLVYIGDAVLVEGARPDIETAYPGFPGNYKAGWGYNLLTNGLPHQGNGTFTLYAKAADKEGNIVTLGTKTIECDNINATKPFGAIDTPAQGGTASGRSYVNFGWALTPLPNTIPEDGSTITIWVDGVPIGHPVYNVYRTDIEALFPGYHNSTGAGGHFYLDTLRYENGVHTIAWSVEDNAGNIDGIGSRYFTIQNTGGTTSVSQNRSPMFNDRHLIDSADILQIPPDDTRPVHVKKGYNQSIEPKIIYPDNNGNIIIEIKELQRLEVYFPVETRGIASVSGSSEPSASVTVGFQLIGERTAALPTGSFLDTKNGIFSWQPGPGYLGDHELVFIEKIGEEVTRKLIMVRVRPKFE